MAPSIQAASVVNCHEMVTKTDGSSTGQVAAGGADTSEKFAPSGGDFFVTYVPPISQRSEDRMRERAEQLKGQVRQAFKGSKDAMTIADALTYVDTLERLGIDNHFREEIEGTKPCPCREGGDWRL